MSGLAEGTTEALRRMEARLDQASRAAESLMSEVAWSVGGSAERAQGDGPASDASAGDSGTSRIPPAGWQSPNGDPEQPGELQLVLRALGSLGDMIPADLQQRLLEAFRELLVAVKALIDWYLERMEHRVTTPAEVVEIPIA